MKPLVETNTKALSIAILLLRIMSGLILFVGGAGKVLGWFGGMGMSTTVNIFNTSMHLSAFWTHVSCYTEFIGGLLIIIGLFTRLAAFALFVNMLVATLFVGFKNFFLGGAAYPCLLMVIFLVIILSGPMAYSIDAVLATKKKTEKINRGFSMVF
jgi:putative oxidoreductase